MSATGLRVTAFFCKPISIRFVKYVSSVFVQLMAVEVEEEYGGTNGTFFMANLVIEELAKVDASVSVMVDVHNTLIINLLRQHGTPEQKDKYLPRLASNMV